MTKYNCEATIHGTMIFDIEAENDYKAAMLAEEMIKTFCIETSDGYQKYGNNSYCFHIKPGRVWVGCWPTDTIIRLEKPQLEESMK